MGRTFTRGILNAATLQSLRCTYSLSPSRFRLHYSQGVPRRRCNSHVNLPDDGFHDGFHDGLVPRKTHHHPILAHRVTPHRNRPVPSFPFGPHYYHSDISPKGVIARRHAWRGVKPYFAKSIFTPHRPIFRDLCTIFDNAPPPVLP